MAYKIDKDLCIGCAACLDECPVGAIAEDDGKCTIDSEKCIDCGACSETCPVDAPKEA